MITANLVLAIKANNLDEEDQNNLADLINLRCEFIEKQLSDEKMNQLDNLTDWFNDEFLMN